MPAMGFSLGMRIGSLVCLTLHAESAAGTAVPISRNLQSRALATRAVLPGMEIADFVIVVVLLVTIPLAIALILRWRAGRLAKDRTHPKEEVPEDFSADTRTLRNESVSDAPPDVDRASWAWFLDSPAVSVGAGFSRSNTASTRQLYISNQMRRAQQKAAEIENASTPRMSVQSEKTVAARASFISTRTMATLVDGRPTSLMWSQEDTVPPMPAPPPVALHRDMKR
ncbi:hypothetical protein MKEN_01241400 [Mycena kentingensis (nom. inval.)]|nr:hypothetical protein MKEN_01241400 [Mycena kentingensis (nom. inval.)]